MSNFYQLLASSNKQHFITCGKFTIVGNISRQGHKYFIIDLRDKIATDLPSRLIIYGTLILQECDIIELPSELKIYDSLALRGTPITIIPADLEVGGSLLLGNSQLQELPDAFYTGNTLDLQNTPIQHLPGRLYVGGDLNIQGTDLSYLPDDLFVGGHLILDATKIDRNLAYRQFAIADLSGEPARKCRLFCDDNDGKTKRHHRYDLTDKITVFAVRLQGEIKISIGSFFGTAKELTKISIPSIGITMIHECIYALENR